MIVAIILAAGKGTRINRAGKPKQYLDIGDKPMLCHTVEKFLACRQINHIVVVVHKDWIQYTIALLAGYEKTRISVCEGAENRQESLYRALVFCQVQLNVPDETVILSHDAARPFVTQEIILANIQAMQDAEAVTTVIPAVDTIIQSEDGLTMASTTDRKQMYQVQTPQAFYLKQYQDIYAKLDRIEKMQLTDAFSLFCAKGLKVRLVRGHQRNFKITTDYDMQLAGML
jgi:2-C-methyl-D-erythritol 4-phosphate cytidylyltransferase